MAVRRGSDDAARLRVRPGRGRRRTLRRREHPARAPAGSRCGRQSRRTRDDPQRFRHGRHAPGRQFATLGAGRLPLVHPRLPYLVLRRDAARPRRTQPQRRLALQPADPPAGFVPERKRGGPELLGHRLGRPGSDVPRQRRRHPDLAFHARARPHLAPASPADGAGTFPRQEHGARDPRQQPPAGGAARGAAEEHLLHQPGPALPLAGPWLEFPHRGPGRPARGRQGVPSGRDARRPGGRDLRRGLAQPGDRPLPGELPRPSPRPIARPDLARDRGGSADGAAPESRDVDRRRTHPAPGFAGTLGTRCREVPALPVARRGGARGPAVHRPRPGDAGDALRTQRRVRGP